MKRAAYREGLKSHRGGRPPLEAARHAAHRRPRDARPRGVPPPGARPGGRPRPLQGARVPGPGPGVRPGGREPAAAEHRLLLDATGDRGRRGRGPRRRAASRSASCVTSPQAMRAQALGIALAWAPGRSAYVPLAHSAIDVPQAPRPRGGARGASPAARGRRRSARSRPTPSATGSSSSASACASPASPSTRSSPPTCSTPAGGPTPSRTSRWSTSASAARPAPTGSPPPRRRRSATGQAAGGEAELVLRLDRPMTERLEAEGLLADLRGDGDAARRGPGRPGAGRGEGGHRAPRRA